MIQKKHLRRIFCLLLALAPLRARAASLPGGGGLATSDTATTGSLAKFEPSKGCYVGAFIERDLTLSQTATPTVEGRISAFEELTRKKHASYFTYVGYGRPFPADWVYKVKKAGAAPHIAFEPNNGLDEVQDDDYLRDWARDAARTGVPIFLRWASEMNGPWVKYSGDPEKYKEKFRLVAKVMQEEAPNVAMVWTPFAEPRSRIAAYYPGDDAVDWVGVNIYSVYVHNGDPAQPAFQEDPIDFLRFMYDTYAARKPIHVSEFAATLHCKATDQDTTDFAIEKINRFYSTIRKDFPRVKSINYFCLDTIGTQLANNNYSFLSDGRVLATYRKLMDDDYFLSNVSYDPEQFPHLVKAGTTLGRHGTAFRPDTEDSDDLLASMGAVATDIKDPVLRGVKNGDQVSGSLQLSAQMPLSLQPLGIIWQVDGRTVALTNAAPFHVTIAPERIGTGKHTARILVLGKDHSQHQSEDVEFTVVEDAK